MGVLGEPTEEGEAERESSADTRPSPPQPSPAPPRPVLPRPRLGGLDDPQSSRARLGTRTGFVTTRPNAANNIRPGGGSAAANGHGLVNGKLSTNGHAARGAETVRNGASGNGRPADSRSADAEQPVRAPESFAALNSRIAANAASAAHPANGNGHTNGSNGYGSNGHGDSAHGSNGNSTAESATPAGERLHSGNGAAADGAASANGHSTRVPRQTPMDEPAVSEGESYVVVPRTLPQPKRPHVPRPPRPARPRRSLRPSLSAFRRALKPGTLFTRKPKEARAPKPPRPVRVIDPKARRLTLIFLTVLAVAFGSLAGLMMVYSIELPQVEELEKFRPISTTELYDVHGGQVGSFALERRVVVGYSDFSPLLRDAVVSIEDKNFDSHWGVNILRVAGAAYRDLSGKGRLQGASTLTMQLSRNLFLSNDRTFSRKLQEVMFSIQVEHHFTKAQIFTLYANQIYLGHGMYGFEAASEYYFSKHARDLTLPEAALLAGIPKSPNGFSPLLHPERATVRRNHVLREMAADGRITQEEEQDAASSSLGLNLQSPPNSEAPWFVEEIRQSLEKQFGSDTVHTGLHVYTTMDLQLQRVATKAVLDGLAAYERRHGWKGYLQHVDLNTYRHPDWNVPVQPGAYVHGVVTFVEPSVVTVKIGNRAVTLEPDGWAWTGFRNAKQFLTPGDVVYVHLPDADRAMSDWHAVLEQDSGAQGALLAIDNSTGDILAMVGGRDFQLSQFNRATQAQRQVGSSFKPYVYAAAVEDGAKPEDRIDDSPTTFPSPSGPYTPHNFDNSFKGNMSLLAAFADSRNIPALKLAARVGMKKVIDLAHRCGVTSDIPAFLPVALGAASLTLLEHTSAYSVFPNDGLRIPPRLVKRVTSADGRVLATAPARMTSAMDASTAQTMLKFLQEVVRAGTGGAARSLNHPLGGKTGTTNDFTDAWFMGFSPSVTTGVWVGYDDRTSLGKNETGAHAALPIWMDFMRVVVAMHPGEQFSTVRPQPPPETAASPDAADETGAVAKPDSADDSATPTVKQATPDAGAGAGASVPGAPPVTAPVGNGVTAKPADTAPAVSGSGSGDAEQSPASAVRPAAPGQPQAPPASEPKPASPEAKPAAPPEARKPAAEAPAAPAVSGP